MKTIVSLRKVALISGWGILIMTLCYFLAEMLVFQGLIVPDDAATTATNIRANTMQFRIGICGFLLVILCDLLVAWALYVFLKPVNTDISLFAGWFRLVYTVIFAVALGNYFKVLQMVGGADYLTGFDKGEGHAQAMLAINTFNDTWAIGFVFFGLHLGLLGYLALKSNYVPKILGILLMMAGVSYLIDYFTQFLFPEINFPISTYLGWGELIFMFWLLLKGGKNTSI